MPSTLKVPVVKIDEIRPHPDPKATKIEIAVVGGWQTVVPKGEHKAGDIVLYVPVDAVIPEGVSNKWGVAKYLSKGRVKAVKLRGAMSYGFIVHMRTGSVGPDIRFVTVGELLIDRPVVVGEDLADEFGITKYEPPITYKEGEVASPHALFHKYTDVEQYQNYPDVLQAGEDVVISEKIHGSNARVGLVLEDEGVFVIGSHNLERKQGQNSKYQFPLDMGCVQDLLNSCVLPSGGATKSVILFGEIYGSGVQKPTTYGLSNGHIEFRAFDLSVDGEYVSWAEFQHRCQQFGVPTVPPLYIGPFDPELFAKLSGGKTVIGGDHLREGIVVKPVEERHDDSLGRVILKHVSDDWLLRKDKVTDSH